MKAQGLARLGRDAELRRIPSGEAVINLSLAFSYGKKGDDGKRQTQWVEAALFGKRAEALAPYLLKGGLVVAYLDDVHIETYQGKQGEGHKLVGRIGEIELAGGRDTPSAPAEKPAPAPAAPVDVSSFDTMDSDIPF